MSDGATSGADGAPTGEGGASGNDAATDAATDAGMQAVDVGIPPPVLCPVETPLMPTIIDFSSVPVGATDGRSWGSFGTDFSGYTYYYNTVFIKSDVTTGVWHLTGNVADYSGFGLGFSCGGFITGNAMIDASAYAGIEFTIQGNAGTPSQLTFSVNTAPDDVVDPYNPGFARCVPAMNQYDGTCAEPRVIIDVTPTLQTIALRWSDLLAGRPSPVNPAQITRITWAFNWPEASPDGSTSGYPIDISIGRIAFIPGSSSNDAAVSDGPTATDGPTDGTSPESSTDAASTDEASTDDGASSSDGPTE